MGGTYPSTPTCHGHPRSSRGGDKQRRGVLAPPCPQQLLMLGRGGSGTPIRLMEGILKARLTSIPWWIPPGFWSSSHIPASLPPPPTGCGADPQLSPLQRTSTGWERAPEKSPSCRTVPTSAVLFKPRANPSGVGCWTLGSPSRASLSQSQFPRHPPCSVVPSCPRTALSPQPCCFQYRPAALSPSQGHPPDLRLLGSSRRGIFHHAPPPALQTSPPYFTGSQHL